MIKKELLAQSNSLKPIVHIGKSGLTDSVLDEIKKHLKKRKLIKIKCLSFYLDNLGEVSNKEKVRMVAQSLSDKLNAEIIQVVGFTFTLYYGNRNK